MMSLDLLFSNQSGAAAAAGSDYEKDVFPDVSLLADSNSGLTDTALTNPTRALVDNGDATAFQAKTLLIKGTQLIADRTKWIGQKPTYQIIFDQPFPALFAYAYGSFTTESLTAIAPWGGQDSPLNSQKYLKFSQADDGIGVTGKIRRLQWLVQGDTSSTATAMRVTDGSNTSTINFSGVAATSDTANTAKFAAYAHQSSNETNNLHTFQLVAQQQNTLKVVGVVVYYENSGANIQNFAGDTYVNKEKVSTSSGATFAVPAFGSSMGGVFSVAKSTAGYSLTVQGWSPIVGSAVGSSGTNLIDVSAGTGSSYQIGMGIVAAQGTSMYVGMVRSISTDTLTMHPTLAFGISSFIYSSWLSGATYPISQTMMSLETSIGASNMNGLTSAVLDPNGRFALWGANVGMTQSLNSLPGYVFRGASGFLQIDGYFQGVDIELLGNGQRFHATMSVNGLPAWSENAGVTGSFRRTLLTNAGNCWNSVVVGAGASMGAVMITGINLYTSQPPSGISYGVLSYQRVNQAETNRGAQNATFFSLGVERRVYADQLFLSGAWTRGLSTGVAGGAFYYGSSTNCALDFQYYGKDMAVLGSFPAGSTLTIDGAGVGLSAGLVIPVASNGFHTVRITTGSTATIQALDFFAPYDEVVCKQNVYDPSILAPKNKSYWKKFSFSGVGTYSLVIPGNGATLATAIVNAAGGGGGGGRPTVASSSNCASAGGGAASGVVGCALSVEPGNYSVTIGAGGAGSAVEGTSGATGSPTFISDVAGNVVFYVDGGLGGSPGTTTSGGAGGVARNAGGSGGAGTGQGSGSSNLVGSQGQHAGGGSKYVGGAAGVAAGSNTASGGGGGSSPFGIGGTGGTWNVNAASDAGVGAGGGGGGGSDSGTANGGPGGAGALEIFVLLAGIEQ